MIAFTVPRAVFSFLGNAFWQETYDVEKFPKNMNTDFVQSSKPFIEFAFAAIVVIGLILSLACWRFRFLRKWIYYFELVSFLLTTLLPLDMGKTR